MSKNTCSTFHICVTVFPHISMYCFWESKSYKNLSLPPVSMSVVRECVFRRGCQTYWLHLWKDGKWKILHLTMELKLRYIHNCEEERFKGAITVKRKNSIVSSDRSSYSDDGLLYIYRTTFWIFTQSIDAIDVTSVTLSCANSINAIDVTRC